MKLLSRSDLLPRLFSCGRHFSGCRFGGATPERTCPEKLPLVKNKTRSARRQKCSTFFRCSKSFAVALSKMCSLPIHIAMLSYYLSHSSESLSRNFDLSILIFQFFHLFISLFLFLCLSSSFSENQHLGEQNRHSSSQTGT